MGTGLKSKVSAYEGDPDLRKLLKAWVNAVERYSALFENDNCWWYNERASLSTLAGAAWTLEGWIALEEFSTRKRRTAPTDGVESGELRSGRCDLYVSSKKAGFAIEAKQAWQPVGRQADGFGCLLRAQKAAWYDCWHLTKVEAERRFAATFVVPTIPLSYVRIASSKKDEVDRTAVVDLVKRWIRANGSFASARGRKVSYAYTFPKIDHAPYIKGKHVYPGVLMILEEMSPWAKRPELPV